LNGKDFPVTGAPDYDSLSAKRVDSNTTGFTLKKGGKETGTTSRTVSKDGRTLTAQFRTKVTEAQCEFLSRERLCAVGAVASQKRYERLPVQFRADEVQPLPLGGNARPAWRARGVQSPCAVAGATK
jgi:hypothetical protein